MSESSTSICNMALARIGAKRINDYGDASDTKLEAVYCRLFYDHTAKALMRSHLWRGSKSRVQLSQNTTDPAFKWSYSYALPNDFLRLIRVYDGSDLPGGATYTSYELEGKNLLTDEATCYIEYIKWVSSEGEWDSLFIEVLVLQLARKLIIPLSLDVKLKQDIDKDLAPLMRQVRALDRQEGEHIGRDELLTWRDARYSDYP